MTDYKLVPVDAIRRAASILGSQGFEAWDQLASELESMIASAPAVQGEPVEYQCHSCRKTTPPPAPFKAYVECGECGALTAAPIAARLTAPQSAEQRPAPDVEALVEALEEIANLPMNSCSTENDYRLSAAKAIALAAVRDFRDDALAAHRKGEKKA